MTPDTFLVMVAGQLVWPGLAGVGAMLTALVVGTVVVQARAVPPWLVVGFMLLPLILVEAVAGVAAAGAPTGLEAHEARMAAMVGVRVFAPLLVAPGALVLAALCAIAAFRGSKQRSWGPSGLMLLVGVALLIAPIAVGVREDDLGLAILRGGAHFVACALAAVALAGASHGEDTLVGPATMAVACMPMVVAAFELGARALPELILLFTLPGRQPANRAAYVERGWADVVAPWVTPSWVELTVAVVVACLVVAWLSRARPARAAVLWVVPVVVLALVVGAPTMADVMALALALPTP